MKLIVGLGNPGKEYEKTRHNVGFRVVGALSLSFRATPHPPRRNGGGAWKFSEKFHALLVEANTCILVLPQTFMNLSGKSIAALVNFYKLDPAKDLLVISDDKDMEFGKIRERKSGSSGGHKGLQSIIDHLETNRFHRIKIGVGHVDQKIPTDAFVLERFTEEEEEKLSEIIDKAVGRVKSFMQAQ